MFNTTKSILVKLFWIGVIFSSIQSCNTTDPPIEEDNLKPGRRDYVWTADTLLTDEYEWFGITDVWGNSPESIWMTTTSTQIKDRLWYYDGTKWYRYNNQTFTGTLYTVFGAVPGEIWMGDSESNIWRNTGNGWHKFKQFSLPGFNVIIISSIYGSSPDNLFAVGFAENYSDYKGIILKYDGKDWKFLNFPDIKVGFHKIKKMKNGKYLIWGSNSDNGFLDKLFVFDGNSTLKEIYSDYHYPGLYEMNGEIYVTINYKIYKCTNDKLEIWKEFPISEYYGTVLGRSEKDFFGSGYEGILHYNGTDLKLLYSTHMDLYGALIFEKDVYFAGYHSETGTNVILRGTIKEE